MVATWGCADEDCLTGVLPARQALLSATCRGRNGEMEAERLFALPVMLCLLTCLICS